jgi:hypothetical protein
MENQQVEETTQETTENSQEQNRIHVQSNSAQQKPMTYIEIVTEKDEQGQPLSVLEVDLVISREKGQETRSLSINFAGIDTEKKELIEKSVSIDEEGFYILKQFFSQLEWNN